MRTIRIGATWGAAVGAGIAIVMTSLISVRPFSVPVNGFIESAAVRLCPPLLLDYFITSWAEVSFIAVVANALLYGALFALFALIIVSSRQGS